MYIFIPLFKYSNKNIPFNYRNKNYCFKFNLRISIKLIKGFMNETNFLQIFYQAAFIIILGSIDALNKGYSTLCTDFQKPSLLSH